MTKEYTKSPIKDLPVRQPGQAMKKKADPSPQELVPYLYRKGLALAQGKAD